jgi:putative ABC transport system permease protein
VVSQVALSFILLVMGSLLMKSFLDARRSETGFKPDNVLTLQLNLPREKYRDPSRQVSFQEQALQRISSLPGVEKAGATTTLPFVGNNINGFIIEGSPEVQASAAPSADYYAVSKDYFQVLGIPLIEGRYFNDQDGQNTPPVVIINQSLGRRFFPNQNPIGKRLRITNNKQSMREIVGVVGDVRQYGMEQDVTPQMYEAYTQNPQPNLMFAVRTTGSPLSVANAIRSQVIAVDHDQPITNMRTMEEIVSDSLAPRRFTTVLLNAFAAVAFFLSTVGLYGVMSYSVAQRIPEISIRMALGAQKRRILSAILGDGMRLALIGLAFGLAGSLALSRLLKGLLFAVSPTDANVFAGVQSPSLWSYYWRVIFRRGGRRTSIP